MSTKKPRKSWDLKEMLKLRVLMGFPRRFKKRPLKFSSMEYTDIIQCNPALTNKNK